MSACPNPTEQPKLCRRRNAHFPPVCVTATDDGYQVRGGKGLQVPTFPLGPGNTDIEIREQIHRHAKLELPASETRKAAGITG